MQVRSLVLALIVCASLHGAEDSLSFHSLFYLQTDQPDHSGGNPSLDEDEFVFEGVILFEKNIGEKGRLNAKLMGDIIASASETRPHNPQFGALQAHASGNKRLATDVGYTHDFDSLVFGGHFGGGFEANEYGSVVYGVNFGLPFSGDNTRLAFRLDGATDIFSHKLYTGYQDGVVTRQTFSLAPSWLQVLTPLDVVTLSANYTLQFGTLETSYYSIFVNGVEAASEQMPKWRHRGGLGGRWKHSFGDTVSTELGYRFYADDWSILAHTATLSYFQYLFSKHLLLEPSVRFHAQSAAYFFQRSFASVPSLRTSDTDLGDFLGAVLGAKVSVIELSFLPAWLDTISLAGNYWLRNDGFDIFWIDFGFITLF